MSHPRKKSLSIPTFVGQTKILFSEAPGQTGILMASGKITPMDFDGAHAALDWCLKNHVTFYFMPVETSVKN